MQKNNIPGCPGSKNSVMEKYASTYSISLPVLIELKGMDPGAFVSYYSANKAEIERNLLKNGAIKFSGIQIDSVDDFQQIVNSISVKFLNYIDGNSPRIKLSGNVYTSTEYDQTQRITMHNELSYSAKWPNSLFFSCLQPAVSGGETLIADSREILKRMNRDIVSEIEHRGIVYIRNLHSGEGLGPSWQDTFETKDTGQVEAYCQSYGIQFEWRSKDSLRLKQPSRGIIEHRTSGEKVWFNQIDQFHPDHLGEEMLEMLSIMYDSPDDFPTYVTFGDGKEISKSLVREISDTIDELVIAPAWHPNELLVVDNELVCHGRNSFTGDRKVLVAMSE
jgi:Taurine catabolism dioxygenase TauD, TfdA family